MRPPPGAAALLLVALASAGEARADSVKAACARSHEETQVLRRRGRLIEARAQAISCSKDVCPGAVVSACAAWAAELERAVPTLVLAVKDAKGADVSKAAVALDGKPWLDDLPPSALPVDPGEHVIDVTLGGETRTLRVLVREGERARVIEVSFVAPLPAAPPPPPVDPRAPRSAPPPPPPAALPPPSRYPAWAIGLTIGGGALVLGGGSLWLWGTTAACAGLGGDGKCIDGNAVNRRRLTGWIAGGAAAGVGAALLGVGIHGLVTSQAKPAAPVSLILEPGRISIAGWF